MRYGESRATDSMTDTGNEGRQPDAAATVAVTARRHGGSIQPGAVPRTGAVTVVRGGRSQSEAAGTVADTVVGGDRIQPGAHPGTAVTVVGGDRIQPDAAAPKAVAFAIVGRVGID